MCNIYFLASCADLYDQCGGSGWTGSTTCCTGLWCIFENTWYSQCQLATNASTTLISTTSSTTASYVSGGLLNATTGTYWDCCKVSCGWPGKAIVTSPAQTCAQDGYTAIDSNTASVCNSGSAYMCNNQQPWNVNASLSYGYAGAYITVSGS
jgi:hypothetical protein